ncbi:MAG: S-methyl-5'-thioadenosine phosphorylase [Methanomassiliicoccales archaeon]|nr:S-methyl-5'-thioadenosine phosphorylase [Methanomassiliicoccales archaeon]
MRKVNRAKIAIIGGTGVYDTEQLEVREKIKISTPYGDPSGEIQIVDQSGISVAFIPRHGKDHIFPPHKVNYRANIWALKQLGVERVISPCAVGSLQERFRPGEIVVVDQFIDFTKRRDYTFYDGPKTAHISTADPFCRELRQLFTKEGKRLRMTIHPNGTYVCIEGPRFSTRAESRMFRSFGDIIGMTLVPECQLAIEQEMCYVSLAMITDYDVWADRPVDAATVVRTMTENSDNIRKLVTSTIPKIPGKREMCDCPKSLEAAGT